MDVRVRHEERRAGLVRPNGVESVSAPRDDRGGFEHDRAGGDAVSSRSAWRAKGADFVDAPVTGSKIGAEAGQLIFIVGGKEETVEHLKPLFSAMGKQTIRVGETGLGEAAKIGMNLMIAMIYEGFAEALTLTRKLGVPPEKLVELINASMLKNGVVDYKAPFVLKRDYSPNFPLRLMHKDMHIMMDTAKQIGVKTAGTRNGG